MFLLNHNIPGDGGAGSVLEGSGGEGECNLKLNDNCITVPSNPLKYKFPLCVFCLYNTGYVKSLLILLILNQEELV